MFFGLLISLGLSSGAILLMLRLGAKFPGNCPTIFGAVTVTLFCLGFALGSIDMAKSIQKKAKE